MKHLTNKVLFRPPLFLLLLILAGVTLAPPTVWAGGISFTCGCGMAEGDPGDGLEYSGGDIGSDKTLSKSTDFSNPDQSPDFSIPGCMGFGSQLILKLDHNVLLGISSEDISEINKVLFMDIDQEGYQ